MAEAEQTYTVFNTENQQTLTVAMSDDHQQGIQYVTQDGVQLSQLPQPEVKSKVTDYRALQFIPALWLLRKHFLLANKSMLLASQFVPYNSNNMY